MDSAAVKKHPEVFAKEKVHRFEQFLRTAAEMRERGEFRFKMKEWKHRLAEAVAKKCGVSENGKYIYNVLNNMSPEIVDMIREACIGKEASDLIRETYTTKRAKKLRLSRA